MERTSIYEAGRGKSNNEPFKETEKIGEKNQKRIQQGDDRYYFDDGGQRHFESGAGIVCEGDLRRSV